MAERLRSSWPGCTGWTNDSARTVMRAVVSIMRTRTVEDERGTVMGLDDILMGDRRGVSCSSAVNSEKQRYQPGK